MCENSPKEIKTIGKDGNEYIFYYCFKKKYKNDKELLVFRIADTEDNLNMEFFEFKLEEDKNEFLKIIMINKHFSDKYSAKGIPEKMIDVSSKLFKRRIRSSSNITSKYTGESRIESATKMWDRLVSIGKAEYIKNDDYYIYSGK